MTLTFLTLLQFKNCLQNLAFFV